MEQDDLSWRGGTVYGDARAPAPHRQEAALVPRRRRRRRPPLKDFDAVLMRKDPPFDMEYVYSTYLLELAEAQGARVFNRPRAIRDWNEKMAHRALPAVSRRPPWSRGAIRCIREFLAEHRDVILKPLDGMGGASVFRVRHDDPNVNVIVETVTHFGRRTIMAQRYLPEIRDGDKRVLVIGGKPVPHCLARIPKAGRDARQPRRRRHRRRAQAHAGATARSPKRWGRSSHKQGLLLVGLDVIGDHLTEVNVTSPTCFQEITEQTGFNVAGMFMDALATAAPSSITLDRTSCRSC